MNSSFDDTGCDFQLSSDEAIPFLFNIYHTIIFLGFVPLIVTVGTLGNLALFFVVYRIKGMRNTTNFYLCNLAMSDTALLLVGGVQHLVTYYTTPLYIGDLNSPTGLGCFFNEMTVRLFIFASIFFICLVTFKRYLAICHPMKHLKVKGKRWTLKMTVGAWIVSLLMSATAYPHNEVYYACVSWPDESRYQSQQSKFAVCVTQWNRLTKMEIH